MMERVAQRQHFWGLIALARPVYGQQRQGRRSSMEGNKDQSGELKRWREIAPLVYREIDGFERIRVSP